MTKKAKSNLKDIAVRAGKTFIQAFMASLAVANMTDLDSIKAVLIAAISAGISATWNSLLVANDYRK